MLLLGRSGCLGPQIRRRLRARANLWVFTLDSIGDEFGPLVKAAVGKGCFRMGLFESRVLQNPVVYHMSHMILFLTLLSLTNTR